MSTSTAPADIATAKRSVAGDPRPTFFPDPGQDALWDLVMALTNELGATRARLDALERVLTARQALAPDEIDAWVPDAAAATARALDHQRYIRRVYNTLVGEHV
jgi:hypothetical protein